jgi:hypothetical protein
MKGSLIAAVAAGVIVTGCASASPSASQSQGSKASQSAGQDGSEQPPQCVTVAVSENSGNGPVLSTKWCGTGSNGAAPMKANTGQLTVDGSALDPASCTQANPCVIVWPHSPPASQSKGQSGGEQPPQCVTVAVSENSGNGPVLWTKWCGTGSNGAAPMKANTGQLTVDGSALDPASCTQANPCVIVWPHSPSS